MGNGRLVGLGLVGLAVIVESLGALWLVANVADSKFNGNLAPIVLGLGLLQACGLPLLGIGVYLIIKARQEAGEMAGLEKQRAILNIVQTKGRVKITDLALELKLTRDQIKANIYDLVGKGLFTGYINWNDGVLIAQQASEMQTTKCPNCGGERELVGQGVVKCPYCGSELFI